MKRTIALFLTAVLCVFCLSPVSALAEDAPVITLDTTTYGAPVAIGNSVRVYVRIKTGEKPISNVSISSISSSLYAASSKMPSTVDANSDELYALDFIINQYLDAGEYSFNIHVYYNIDGSSETKIVTLPDVTIQKTTPAASMGGGSTAEPELSVNDATALILDPLESVPVLTARPGQTVRISLPLYNRSALTLKSVQMYPKISTNVEEYPFVINSNNYVRNLGSIRSAGKVDANYDLTVSDKATNGTKLVTFMTTYIENNEYCEFPLMVYLTITGGRDSADSEGDTTVPLVVAATNSKGETVKTPTGDAGDKITVTLPIKNRGDKTVTNIEIYPQLSADPASFPFNIGSSSYERSIATLNSGETKDVSYSFTLSDKVTSGVKPVNYSVIYKDDSGGTKQIELTTYVNVRKGYNASGSVIGPDGETLVVQPKLIITSYDLPERILAGSEFLLSITVKNASDTDTVKNVKMTVTNSESVLLPAQGGSNTLFVRSLSPGEETVQTINLQSVPDAASKSHMLDIKFDYNNAAVNSFTSTETIAIPIKQELRVTVDEPHVYVEGASVGNSFYASVQFYNKGKSQVYNVTLKLKSENDTMRLEEGYYGGNMSPGSSASADISVLPLSGGDLFGAFVIQYEDEYGEVYEVEKEFTVYIQDNSGGDMMGGDMMGGEMPMPGDGTYGDGMYGEAMGGAGGEGLPTWALIAICVGGAAVLVTAFILIRKSVKKKREAELNAE